MPPSIDITGQRPRPDSRWTVVARTAGQPKNLKGGVLWDCRCDCGTEKSLPTRLLRGPGTLSCGCLNRERVSAACRKHGHARDNKVSSEYSTWHGMIQRCVSPAHASYKNYGGRGITVCDRWKHSFENFLADVGPKPSPNHTIDRHPDPNGNYEPGNVRWATVVEQNSNRRNNVKLTWDGITDTQEGWASRVGLDASTLRHRLKRGWDVGRALTTPARPQRGRNC